MAPRNKKKPAWIVEKERARSAGAAETVWYLESMPFAMLWKTRCAKNFDLL